jgi:ATP-dependent Clp protease protease subunit
MNYIKPDISTICMGQAASMAAVLLAAGTKGKRSALPNARVMIHQPWGGTQGAASDIAIQAEQIVSLKKRLNKIMADQTGQTLRKIEKDADRDFYMTTDEAKAYGLIDYILQKR